MKCASLARVVETRAGTPFPKSKKKEHPFPLVLRKDAQCDSLAKRLQQPVRMYLRFFTTSLGGAVLATSLCSVALHAQGRTPPVLVQRVIDSNSIEIATIGRVNLLGIAAPRAAAGRSQTAGPVAREAQQRLEGLLAHRWVRLEYEDAAARSGRAAYVFLDDGRFVNAWMLREGLARAAATGLRRSPELVAAEGEAKSSRRGIWRNAR